MAPAGGGFTCARCRDTVVRDREHTASVHVFRK